MEKNTKNNIRLGTFVLAGAGLFMFFLYYIGRNENKWVSGVEVRVHFSQLNGLVEGNNVLYSGMPAGSVRTIRILDDTTIEVALLINKKTSPFIHRNALVSIASDGLLGNKVVNITPGPGNEPLIANGDLLTGSESVRFDKVLPKVLRIGDDVAVISATLRNTVLELDSSELLRLLKDRRTAAFLVQSLVKLNRTADNAAAASGDVRAITASIRQGNGSIGELLRDTGIVSNLRAASAGLRIAAETIDDLSLGLREKISSRSGLFNLVLTDSGAARDLRASLGNIRRGTDNFNQDMEALQHNFLLRGYFRRKARDSAAASKGEAH